ncbi:MAG: hypothetical protein WCN98_16995 [Verrucomicrobiaceae bacterium]
MIFWKGRGLLILVFAVLGGSAFAGLFTAISHRSSTEWNTAITLIGASIGAWISALTFCKPEQRTLLDPTTGKPVILIQSHDLYFISARSWAILSSLVAVFTIFLAIAAGPPDEIPAGASAPSGKAKSLFSNVNSLIDTYKNKEVHGNNFAAEKLAQDLSPNCVTRQ